MRHQTAAATKGGGAAPLGLPPSCLGGGVDPLPLSLYKGCPLAPSSSIHSSLPPLLSSPLPSLGSPCLELAW